MSQCNGDAPRHGHRPLLPRVVIRILFHTLELIHWDSQVPATLKRWSFPAVAPRSLAQECHLLLLWDNGHGR